MESEATTYYVVDSLAQYRAYQDSVDYNSLFKIEKDSAIYFSKDKLKSLNSNTSSLLLKDNGHEGIVRTFSLENEDGVLVLLLLCFLFFTRIYKGGAEFFEENSRLLFSNRKNPNLFTETTITEFWFNFSLLFQFVVLTSIVSYDLLMECYQYRLPQNSFITILLFIAVIALFILLKLLFYRFLCYVFDLGEYRKMLQRIYIIILEMMSMIAFLPTLMLVYSQNLHTILIFFFIGLFILSRIVLFYRIIVFFLRQHVNLLFLIVYLCNVEIIPYIILYNVLIYLYDIDLISLLWL